MTLRLFVLVTAPIFATACGSASPAAPTTLPTEGVPVAFAGRVFDYRTNAPVPAASLTILLSFPDSLRATSEVDGRYTLTVPHTGVYAISINGRDAGALHVNGPAFRGDLFVDTMNACIARYGVIIDSRTLRPISDANVTIGPGTNIGSCSTSGSDGWYRCDLGCPSASFPSNTTVFGVNHPDYEPFSQLVGRGIGLVLRADVALAHK